MQYAIAGGIWIVVVAVLFWAGGAMGVGNISRLNKTELHPHASHQLHFENNIQLTFITILLSAILAVLITALLVR